MIARKASFSRFGVIRVSFVQLAQPITKSVGIALATFIDELLA